MRNKNYKVIGIKLLHEGDFKRAELFFKKHYKVTKNKWEFYNSLGNVFRAAGANKKAVDYYEKSLKLKPEFGLTWSNLSKTLANQGKFKEALSAAAKALKLLPRSKNFQGLIKKLKAEIKSYKKKI